ncbi:hypothetical protein ACF1AE_25730 [Streptomyces sp. NPDC014986]|uniref:hypothetical protein n=1 Tax=Streptomyces sp. NPDC014986 TaxID=3364934 RepID=UPI003702F5AF
MNAGRHHPPTRRELAEDELTTDRGRGRKNCPVHRTQEMIPLGVATVCPLPHDGGESSS